ncbi:MULTISPECIES: DUF2711 family protein [unclassified Bacillus (in: firmicutes)]|uniref:DUF2711 family protein n=1 Tax=unclassified Bacillus (in: firmicutes) TaxID=185979 RepID=UPI0020C5EF3A|nr:MULTISPECIES: DUF2711 family protein [unclassified Bacillus (in: firmicutes)]
MKQNIKEFLLLSFVFEMIDVNMGFAFMSTYDSFTTLFFTKDENIKRIAQSMNWEAIICNEQTYIHWYF